jgi:hypothetical protein
MGIRRAVVSAAVVEADRERPPQLADQRYLDREMQAAQALRALEVLAVVVERTQREPLGPAALGATAAAEYLTPIKQDRQPITEAVAAEPVTTTRRKGPAEREVVETGRPEGRHHPALRTPAVAAAESETSPITHHGLADLVDQASLFLPLGFDDGALR